jgi:hypothetical protein
VETFLQAGGTKSSQWKPSCDLQDDSAEVFIGRGICRAFPLMFLLVVGFAGEYLSRFWDKIPSLARQKSLTKLKTRGCSIY